MRVSSMVIGGLTGVLVAIAFWADGSSIGQIVVSSIVLGLAAVLTARQVEPVGLQLVIAGIYLGALALASVAAFLIDKGASQTGVATLLSLSMIFPAIGLGWACCDYIIRSTKVGANA